MTKYVILSVNNNEDYLYFTPLTCWAWRQFGWEPIVFYNRKGTDEAFMLTPIERLIHSEGKIKSWLVKNIGDYRSDTITQISRLYGACLPDLQPDDYLMTCDIDMIPLSDYWKHENKFTVWGHDLTSFKNFPLCYIGAPVHLWRSVMNLDGDDYQYYIQRDLDSLPQAKSPDFYTYWETDQDHITARLKVHGTGNIHFINRGQGAHGFARGRVDKGHGGWVLDQPELIDAHLLQQAHHSEDKIHKIMDLLHHVWPDKDWLWFLKFTHEFKKLTGK